MFIARIECGDCGAYTEEYVDDAESLAEAREIAWDWVRDAHYCGSEHAAVEVTEGVL